MALKQFNKKADENFWDNQWSLNSFERSIEYVKNYKQYSIMKKYTDKNSPALEGGCGLSQWVHAMHHDKYDVMGIDYAEKTVNRINKMNSNTPGA